MQRLLPFVVGFVLISSNVSASNLPDHEGNRAYALIRAIKSIFLSNRLQITIHYQDGNPLEDSLVMVGNAPGTPFEHNVDYTDQDGVVIFTDDLLKPPYTVTAYKEGFNAYTIYDMDVDEVEIKLTPLAGRNAYVEIYGELTGWQQMVNGDDIFSAAFVTPLLFFDEVVNFNLSTLLGPDCKMDLYGERDVPCNIIIPEQVESYIWVPVSLYKPNYSLRIKKDRDQDFLALSGDIPFTSTMDLIIGGGSFERVLDQLVVRKIGLKLDQEVNKNKELNIDLSNSIKSNQIEIEVKNRPVGRSMILISLADLDNKSEQFIPSGIRVIQRREGFRKKNLSSVTKDGLLKDSSDIVVAAAVDLPENKDDKDNDSKIIGIISRKTNELVLFDSFFLPLDLTLSEAGLTLSDVNNQGISPTPDLSFTSLRRIIRHKKEGEIHETIWSVVSPAAQKTITLPQLPITIIPDPSLTPENDKLYWTAGVFTLDQNQTMFDYNLLSSRTIARRLTHFSWNRIEVGGNGN